MAAVPDSIPTGTVSALTAPADNLDSILAGTVTAANEATKNLPVVMTPHPLEGVDDVMQAARIIGQMLVEEKNGKAVRSYPRAILRQQHIAAFTLVNPFATTTEICGYFCISPSVLTNIRKSDTYKALVAAHNIAVADLSEDINHQLRETLKVAIEVTQDAVIAKRDPEFALATMDKVANRLGLGAKHNSQINIQNNIVTPDMLAEARAAVAKRLPDAT